MFGLLEGLIKLLPTIFMALSLPLLGVLAMGWWDNRPAHFPSLNVPVLFFHIHLEAPESLAAQRDAYKVGSDKWQKAFTEVDGALKAESASLEAWKKTADEVSAAAQVQAERDNQHTSSVQEAAKTLLERVPRGDKCQAASDLIKEAA